MKAVLFDFGGTIDTDGVHWSEKFWEFYQEFKIPIGKRDFEEAFVRSEQILGSDARMCRATFHETLREQLSAQFALLKLPLDDQLLSAMLDACYRDVAGIVGRARELLDKLSKRYRLGVVSNFYGNLEIVCGEFGLDEFFQTMIDSVVVGLRKPDPAIWSLAIDRMEVLPGETWVVGDSYERDIVPSKALGCRTIWLKGKSWTSPQSTEAADVTIGKFDEIRSVLL